MPLSAGTCIASSVHGAGEDRIGISDLPTARRPLRHVHEHFLSVYIYKSANLTPTSVSAFAMDPITPERWMAACEFFGFDENNPSPLSGILLEDWEPNQLILAYEFMAVVFVVQQLLRGMPFSIIGHDMGLNKTLCDIAIVLALSRLTAADDPTNALTLSTPFQQKRMDACVLAGERDPMLVYGPMLISAPPSLSRTWVSETRKFVGISRKLVLVWRQDISTVKMNSDLPGCYRPTSTNLDLFYAQAGKEHKSELSTTERSIGVWPSFTPARPSTSCQMDPRYSHFVRSYAAPTHWSLLCAQSTSHSLA